MNKDVIEVQVRAVLPLEGSFAVFLGNETKVFVIYIDESVGTAISMFMRGVSKERPLTHDLVGHLLLAFGAKVERVVINDINGSVFHARLIISAENELQTSRKVIELDARPSDSIAMAVQQSAPIFVAKNVWDTVEDVSDTLAQIEKKGLEAQQAVFTRGGREIGWAFVATGKEGNGTKPGTYRITEKIVDKYSNRYGWIEDEWGNKVQPDARYSDPVPPGMVFVPAPMPYWMRLTWYGIGMHAGPIPEPGRPASHGCIRLPHALAPVLYEAVKVGTPVTITP